MPKMTMIKCRVIIAWWYSVHCVHGGVGKGYNVDKVKVYDILSINFTMRLFHSIT